MQISVEFTMKEDVGNIYEKLPIELKGPLEYGAKCYHSADKIKFTLRVP